MVPMKSTRLAAFLLAALLISASLPACRGSAGPAGAATISEKSEVFKTYPYGDPDPVPIFARSTMWGDGARLYPYSFFNTFSAAGVDQEWPVVRLENPYISVAVLPKVGGKVWGATDKTTGRDFLYTNHVMKFREIALRGPWTSGGIEFNFGIVGHAPSTASPVDYILRRDPDGGVSCVVGAMDLPSRTRWSVTVRLPKDKAYFETNGAWYNPTPLSQSYYYWSCGAIPTADDLRYIFPGRWQIGHDYNVPLEPWPVDSQGRDLSWYRANATPNSKSYFTVGEREDFYGAWYERSDAGMGHWALYDDMPGRKVWIWDQSRSGEIWVDLLTDSDGQYTEPQAGRLLNQSDHEFLASGTADRWRELWFPYNGIGPMAASSPDGVLAVTAAADRITVGLFPLRAVDDDLVVTAGGRELHRERIKAEPARSLKRDLPLALTGQAFQVRLGESLVFRSDPAANDIEKPLRFKPVDESSAEGLFLSGTRLEKARAFASALDKYAACLTREPSHRGAMIRSAELYARRGEDATALSLAGRALELDMYDPAANYVYGVAARRLGKLVDAKEAFGWAARSNAFRSAAYTRLAELALGERSYALAADYAQRSIDANAFNSGGFEILAAAHRRAGRAADARAALDRLLAIDPLDHLARFELYLQDKSPKSREAFQSMIRNETPHETYIEAALAYLRWGLDDDAAGLLSLAPDHPTAYALRAFLKRTSSPEESRALLDKAMVLSPALVFPFREEEIPLYEWAASQRPADWKPRYYLGLILWSKGRVKEARDLWAACQGVDFAPFFLSRAMLIRPVAPAAAQADYETAVRIDEKTWRNWHALIGFLSQSEKPREALTAARQAAGLFPDEVPIQIDLVRSLMAVGQYGDAAAVLDKVEALPFEGASEIHALFTRTHLQIGLAAIAKKDWPGAVRALERSKEYPETLGTGKPYDADFRIQDYLLGLIHARLGDKAAAAASLQSVVEYTSRFPAARGAGLWFGGQALRRAGRAAQAAEILKAATAPAKDLAAALGTLGQ
jgi:tetratricopeptide (TPR) repeat protein